MSGRDAWSTARSVAPAFGTPPQCIDLVATRLVLNHVCAFSGPCQLACNCVAQAAEKAKEPASKRVRRVGGRQRQDAVVAAGAAEEVPPSPEKAARKFRHSPEFLTATTLHDYQLEVWLCFAGGAVAGSTCCCREYWNASGNLLMARQASCA